MKTQTKLTKKNPAKTGTNKMTSSNFQETIWVAGKELTLIHVYDDRYTPNWDTAVEIEYYSYTVNPSPVFIHRGNLHGYYNEVNANTEVTE